VGAFAGDGVGRDGSRERAQVLAIAVGHRDHLRADGHELSARVLTTLAALRADGKCNLIACPSFISRAREEMARDLHQRRIVIERSAAPPEFVHGLTEERKRFGRNVEAQDVAPCLATRSFS
jgi:CelD/BcsL family acetyltransferase involved in cellulose biosynthesis